MNRVFAAIDISSDARDSIEKYVETLRMGIPDVWGRWETPEKLHITVKFAGSLDEKRLEVFTEQVELAANAVSPFPVRVASTGAFVKRRGPNILWLGVDQLCEGDSLGRIASMLRLGGRPFHPHVTIARIKDAKRAKALIQKHKVAQFESKAFEVNEIVIYKSELLPTGSVYSSLAIFPLRKI